MRFLRRGSTDDDSATGGAPGTAGDGSTDALEPVEASVGPGRGHTAGKGRPTPKRREAEGRRRGPAPPPPKTQREAMKLAKANRASRQERRKGAADRRSRMMAGDQKALLPRDRGPVKAYARDLVDSRRHLVGLFMPLAVVVFASTLLRLPFVQQVVSLVVIAMMTAMILEGVLMGRRITRAARARFPQETISGAGLGWYAFARATQLRRLRVPKPRVAVGATLD